MAKKLLYLEDLYDFYSNTYKKSTHFNANKTGNPIVVHAHGKINFNKNDKNTEGLCPVHLQSCHTNLNVNGSNISESVMKNALPSFSNRPILGYIHKVVTDKNPDGQWEFYSHNMHEDENGDIVYDEHPIGIIPESCNAQLVYDEKKKKTYCEVDGYIFEEYSKASEILQREEECYVSVELSIRSLSYNAKEKYLDIEDFFFSGVTILGKTPDGNIVKPGMENSNIKLSDFSANNNSFFEDYDQKMIELQERLEKLETNCFNKKQNTVYVLSQEGGKNNKMTKFNGLLTKYKKNFEDITFDYESMSDEELEAKFAEMFADDISNKENINNGESFASNENLDGQKANNDHDISFSKEELFNKLFELSFDDIRYALNALCSIYRNDSEWCYVSQVYEDYFIMEDWDNNKFYKQSYEKDEDNIALSGERIEMFAMLLTESEKISIEEMRSNYEALKVFKENAEKNELRNKKEEFINSEKYSVLTEKNDEGNFVNSDFAELVEMMDNYSVEEFETKVKVIHSDYISANTHFSSNNPKEIPNTVKMYTNVNKKAKPKKNYGNLLD